MTARRMPLDSTLPEGAAFRFEDGALRLLLATSIYSIDATLRACYWLTERCYVHLSRPDNETIVVTLLAKDDADKTDALAWQFLNDLIDQQLRVTIQRETGSIRDLIVSQAFSDVDIIDDRGRGVVTGQAPPIDEDTLRKWRPVP
jgi:His-Xaa-Ser system protein HxsD